MFNTSYPEKKKGSLSQSEIRKTTAAAATENRFNNVTFKQIRLWLAFRKDQSLYWRPSTKIQHNHPTGPLLDKFTFNSHYVTVPRLIPNKKNIINTNGVSHRSCPCPRSTCTCANDFRSSHFDGTAEETLQLLRFRRRLPRFRSDFGGRTVEAFCQDAVSEGGVVGDSLLGAVGSAGSFSRVRMVASRSERCCGVSCWIMCTAESMITSGLTWSVLFED